ANICLLAALIAVPWVQSNPNEGRIKSVSVILAGCGFVLLVVYSSMAAFSGIRDVTGLIRWAASYGSGSHMPAWGQWTLSRFGELAKTWVYSMIGGISRTPQWPLTRPVRFDTVFPRLGPLVLAVFLLTSLLLAIRCFKNRVVLWCLIGVAAYVPFLVWW